MTMTMKINTPTPTNSSSSMIMDNDQIQRILESPIPYNNKEEIENAKFLLNTLSDEEMELAAWGSYAYWLASSTKLVSVSGTAVLQKPTREQTLRMATRECRRYLGSPTLEVAEKLLKETCQFRKDRRIDLIRACFLNSDEVQFDNDDDEMQVEKLRYHIENDLSKQLAYVRGHDKDGRALLVVHPRTSDDTDEDEFVLTQIYLMERTIATTEYISDGVIEKITTVFDFNDFQSSLSPSLNAVKRVVDILQNQYSERLQRLIILDPPFWMRTGYSLIRPFLDPVTADKFIMASGSKRKQDTLSLVIDPKQAMPFMLPNGQLMDAVELSIFIHHVPFHDGYDCTYFEKRTSKSTSTRTCHKEAAAAAADDDDDDASTTSQFGTILSLGSGEYDENASTGSWEVISVTVP